jgi:hypothetical protein
MSEIGHISEEHNGSVHTGIALDRIELYGLAFTLDQEIESYVTSKGRTLAFCEPLSKTKHLLVEF